MPQALRQRAVPEVNAVVAANGNCGAAMLFP
jgi:hypothetical protein